MKKENKPEQFIKHPSYPGGSTALREFVHQNLQYPKAALENKIEGTVTVKYEIDQEGVVLLARVISGIGYGCDEEALRVVKLLKFSSVKNRGMRVTFNKTINIRFKLPTAKKGNSTQLVYNYIEKKKEKTVYNINIRL